MHLDSCRFEWIYAGILEAGRHDKESHQENSRNFTKGQWKEAAFHTEKELVFGF